MLAFTTARRSIALWGLTNVSGATDLLRGIIRAGREVRAWSVRTGAGSGIPASLDEVAGIDGVLVFRSAARWLPALHRAGIPAVGVNCTAEAASPSEVAGSGGVPVVVADEREVGPLAADHLLDRGLDEFAYVGFDHPVSHARRRGFVERLAARQKAVHLVSEGWSWRRASSVVAVAAALRRLPRPVGILAFNDEIGHVVIDAALRLGLHVPDDVAVVGVDNVALHGELSAVPLSSVDLNLEEIGYRAARRLTDLMDRRQPVPPVELVPPKGVITRASSDILAIGDPLIADCLRLIHAEACNALTAAEVIARTPDVSRSTLERRFKRLVGRPIAEEIRHTRLTAARALIQSTALPLTEIAAQCGFSDLPHLTRHFTRAYGQSPSALRRSARQ